MFAKISIELMDDFIFSTIKIYLNFHRMTYYYENFLKESKNTKKKRRF